MPELHPRSIRTEFPDYPIDTLPPLWEWADVSWHNDTCPSFKRDKHLVWIDYPDPREREDFGGRRFILCRLDDEGCLPVDGATLIETDNWNHVLAFLN